MSLPLSKTLDPADFDQLTEELQIVDRSFTKATEQHPMRRWEYALALRAQQTWYDQTPASRPQGPVIDVGGAGSPFWQMINKEICRVVDPAEGCSLSDWLREGANLASEVYCLSVLEHVEDLDQFLYHLGCLVAPGGLLFLTMDYCGHPEHEGAPDAHHFHWMRKRIFSNSHWQYLALNLRSYGFSQFGEGDMAYHGAHVFDYSFASLALVKRA